MRIAGGAAVVAAAHPFWPVPRVAAREQAAPGVRGRTSPLADYKQRRVTTDEKPNTFEEITGYNNFYEFGTGKDDPQRYGGR